MSRRLVDNVPKELAPGFRVWIGSLTSRYPNTPYSTIEKLAYKYLHAEMLAEWLLWKLSHREMFRGNSL